MGYSHKRLLLSVVSHGQSDLVRSLLSSIDQYLSEDTNDILICITNNIPSDVTFKSKFEIVIIDNLNPRGFGDNHNAVFERFYSELFVIINPDIVLIENFDLTEIQTLMRERGVSLTSPVILDNKGIIDDYKRKDVTPYNLICRWLFNIEEAKSFDWYCGMFMIIKSESFEELCGFSPRFYLYVEDCEFCIRLVAKGYNLEDVSSVCVQHDARRSSRKSIKMLWLHLRSLLIYWSTRN